MPDGWLTSPSTSFAHARGIREFQGRFMRILTIIHNRKT